MKERHFFRNAGAFALLLMSFNLSSCIPLFATLDKAYLHSSKEPLSSLLIPFVAGGAPVTSSSRDITAFSILGQTGIIGTNTIAVSLPHATDPSSLVATFTMTGASVNVGGVTQISGTTTNDFSSPLTYTVVAANDSTKDYVVTVTVGGIVTTFAGSGSVGFIDGTGTGATFNHPSGMALDAAGNIYVADVLNNAIRKITSGGVVTTFAGSGSAGFVNGAGTAASFNSPYGVTVDSSGNIYVADISNNSIRRITSGGVVTTFAGSGSAGFVNGAGIAASFNGPYGVAVDSSGNIYVADTGNNVIRKITSGGVVTTFAGSGSVGFVNGAGTAASFHAPFGLAVDSSGNIYVADTYNHAIRKITSGGVVTTFAGSGSVGFINGTGTAASFYYPTTLAIDSTGNLYVADEYNHAIRMITGAGVVTTIAGSGSSGFVNGVGTMAEFFFPNGVAVDSTGNVYVADTNNAAIRKIQ